MTTNVFEQAAELLISAPRKRQLDRAEKRAAKKVDHQQRLSPNYQRWRREHLDRLLAGPHAAMAGEFVRFLDQMTTAQGKELVARVETWRAADADTRHEVLSLIDTRIMELRERAGLPPLDDPLPGAPLNLFLTIRSILS